MAPTDHYRTLYGLMIHPDQVAIVYGDNNDGQSTVYVTDRYVIADVSVFGVESAVHDLTRSKEGWYRLRRTGPPLPEYTMRPEADKLVGQLLDKWQGHTEWKPLQTTEWAVSQGVHGHARLLVADGLTKFINSDLVTRWVQAAGWKELRFDYAAGVPAVRGVLVSRSALAAGGTETCETVAGYVMCIGIDFGDLSNPFGWAV